MMIGKNNEREAVLLHQSDKDERGGLNPNQNVFLLVVVIVREGVPSLDQLNPLLQTTTIVVCAYMLCIPNSLVLQPFVAWVL